MPAKNTRIPTAAHRPLARARCAIKVYRPPPENLCKQARLFREHAGVIQVVCGACKLFSAAS